MSQVRLSIAAVERDVGLSKDVLRVWERRYGFPVPGRDLHGVRIYTEEQVEHLRLIKRLMYSGYRPGRLIAMPDEEFALLSTRGGGPSLETPLAETPESLARLFSLIHLHQVDAYTQSMQQILAREGLSRFVQHTMAPLTELIGLGWQQGRLQVFEEHLFAELTERVMRQAMAVVPRGLEPRVLLTTLPNEQHAMGLLMVEALLALEGAQCISLGTQLPLLEVAHAAEAHHADVVGLSFSAAFPARQIPSLLLQLRALLPATIQLWAGGSGVRRVAGPEGVLIAATLHDAVAAVASWRSARE
ncbi:cobalamin-dependent protein [Ramlibacter solisilvae]|uniref:MerR family transcriptional regulator n=1 Tax=Ramlibacter tataouinensis TaxID=94132 RepID=A0A127JVW2_9BURK|nr:MerR family transcriptional regulator [Ramlibacter tataouinensis]AMO24045.1 MerR family transcriptional regulator [Ramlibacter tataouinensis]